MNYTKVSKVMLSTLVTGGMAIVLMFLITEAKAPNTTTGETQIELPSSEFESLLGIDYHVPNLQDVKDEGERLQAERKERLRVELEKAEQAEQARLAKLEADRKAKEEAERLARIEAEKQQQQHEQSTNGTAFNGSYYTPYCNGCSGVTATGVNVTKSIYVDGYRVIAVDPSIIPLYSILEVSTPHETFQAIALDTGGGIKGHKVDILVAEKQTAYSLGRHTVYIKVLKYGK